MMLYFFLIFFIGLRLWFWFGAFPNYDEAYYWLWSQHPAISYFDHPPLLAWLTSVSTSVFGTNPFSLRLVNALTSIGVIHLLLLFVKQFYPTAKDGSHFAPVALVFFASPIFFNFFAIAWNDSVMLFFGLLSVYCFSQLLMTLDETPHRPLDKASRRSQSVWLFCTGTALGLAALAKYNACFFAIGFFLSLLSKREYRRLFLDYRLSLTFLWVLFLFSPVLIWNAEHHFESFRFHLLSRHATWTGFSVSHWVNLRTFTLASILAFSPVLFYLSLKWIGTRKRLANPYERVAFWTALSSTIPLLLLSSNTYVAYHWNITAYLVLLPMLIAELTLPANRLTLKLHTAYGLLMATGIVLNSAVLPLEALTHNDRDPHSRMLYGWDEVGEFIHRQRKGQPTPPLIVTSDYGLASSLAFQLRDRNVFPFSSRRTEFDGWMPSKEERKGRDALLIWDDWHPLSQELRNQFEKVEDLGSIPIRRFGFPVKSYSLALGRNWRS